MSVTAMAKSVLSEAFAASGITKAEFARRMNVRHTIVQRMLDPIHPSKIGQIERALSALGKRMVVKVENLQ